MIINLKKKKVTIERETLFSERETNWNKRQESGKEEIKRTEMF
jgi:hypothetical protein